MGGAEPFNWRSSEKAVTFRKAPHICRKAGLLNPRNRLLPAVGREHFETIVDSLLTLLPNSSKQLTTWVLVIALELVTSELVVKE